MIVFSICLMVTGGLVDAQHAGRFAGRGTDAPGEFRKVVGGVQLPHRLLPAPAVDQIVPIGNDVGQRAAGVAEGHAAIHAARRLRPQVVFRERLVDLEPVLDAHRGVAALRQLPRVFHEAGDFSHVALLCHRYLLALQCPARACIRAGRP